jgi:DNA invertase Pin-like site-specific DNA recombinase
MSALREGRTMIAKSQKRAALYLRVSRDSQTTENQRLDLVKAAEASEWEIVDVYRDHGISGAKGRDQRPELDRLVKDATARRFDVVMAWSLDRLGRSVDHLVSLLKELEALRLDLYLHKERIDTTTPMGRMLFHICGAFAEFERAAIRERVLAGLARARKEGKRLGRPVERDKHRRKVLAERAKGKGIRKIATELGIGVGTVKRLLAAAKAATPTPHVA